MSYYILKNPREGLKSASINVFYIDGKECADIGIEWDWAARQKSLGHYFKGLTAAKRYFSTHYQSKKHNFDKPIWEKQ